MIALVWVMLTAWLGGGFYAANRVLAREDMPLNVRAGEKRARASVASGIRPALAVLIQLAGGRS